MILCERKKIILVLEQIFSGTSKIAYMPQLYVDYTSKVSSMYLFFDGSEEILK